MASSSPSPSGRSRKSRLSSGSRRATLAVESLESRAVPAVVVSPASVSVPEGQARVVNFRLAKPPTADVAFTVQSSNTAEATIDKTTLTFTSANWKAWQSVTVTGVEDLVKDGNKSLKLVTGASVSGDAKFSNLTVRDVTVRTIDSKRVAPIDPARYAGNYSGSFSGRGAFGTIAGEISGRTANITLQITSRQAGLVEAMANTVGTIADDGSFLATADGPIRGASFKGKIAFLAGGGVEFRGTWKYGSMASGTWQISRFTLPADSISAT